MKRKNIKISLQFSMLSIFLSLFIVTMLTIIVVTTIRLYSSMIVISDQQMDQVSSLVNEQLLGHIQPAELSSKLTLELIKNNILDPNDIDQMLSYTVEVLDTLPNTAMVYWGDKNGYFIISRRDSDGSISSEVIKRNGYEATSTHYSRDINKKIIEKKVTEDVTYDPRLRPWYKRAKEKREPTWSKAYIFFTGGYKVLGVTSAAPLLDDKNDILGVVGIDVKLDVISQFLATVNVGQTGVAFIIDDEGQIIAHPLLNKVTEETEKYQITPVSAFKDKSLTKAFEQYQQYHKHKFSYTVDGKTYLAEFKAIPSFKENNWYIATVVPEDDFIGVLKRTNMITLTLSGVILTLGMILITIFAKTISRSVNKLVHQTDKIKNFDLSHAEKLRSYIKEISVLSSGIASMRNGLRAFQKYVPADLVRKLIRQHESATLGGKKKKITIMFTDIDNFTVISESMKPEKLTRHICSYFQHLSRIITRNKGTIDKYIGDAIMAFWGSPTKDADQAEHACISALKIQKRLKLLNEKWSLKKKPPLPTRIGVHSGEAIVGNLGSSERLNYTAIGDTINAASRLESINKIYGTRIIVSEPTVDQVKDKFVFKLLDSIAVKGKTHSILIYELLGKKDDDFDIDVNAYCDLYEVAFSQYQNQKWDEAIETYQEIAQEYPNDHTASLFIKRCTEFKENPPGKDWDGVWRYTEKM